MKLSEIAIEQLEELVLIIEQLTQQDYTTNLPLLDMVSVGKHIRHTLEFHQCFLTREDTFCYDDRSRNPVLESSPQEALKQIHILIDQLHFLQPDTLIEMEVRYGAERFLITTSVHRELSFLIEHMVHHSAILRIALTACFPHIQFNSRFGYADSTIRFQEQSKKAI